MSTPARSPVAPDEPACPRCLSPVFVERASGAGGYPDRNGTHVCRLCTEAFTRNGF